jgi:hypothetical protein
VNIDHVLETMKGTDLEVGAWINVMGYVTAQDEEDTSNKARRGSRRQRHAQKKAVQAVMVWSAGMIKLDTYESALEERRQFTT